MPRALGANFAALFLASLAGCDVAANTELKAENERLRIENKALQEDLRALRSNRSPDRGPSTAAPAPDTEDPLGAATIEIVGIQDQFSAMTHVAFQVTNSSPQFFRAVSVTIRSFSPSGEYLGDCRTAVSNIRPRDSAQDTCIIDRVLPSAIGRLEGEARAHLETKALMARITPGRTTWKP